MNLSPEPWNDICLYDHDCVEDEGKQLKRVLCKLGVRIYQWRALDDSRFLSALDAEIREIRNVCAELIKFSLIASELRLSRFHDAA